MSEDEILDYIYPHASVEEFNAARKQHLNQYEPEMQERIRTWLRIGNENPWIAQAYDPPFTELSFQICADIRELTERILHGNWCLGQAFALEDICFINQVNGGDEWLTIKGSTSFDSITMKTDRETQEEAEQRLRETVEAIRQSTEIQCKRLEYGHPYELVPPQEYQIAPETEEEMMATGRTEPAYILTYCEEIPGQERRECRRILTAHSADTIRILQNGFGRFALIESPESDVRLQYFWDSPKACQEAFVSDDEAGQKLGEDFLCLDPVEKLHRLLPYLQNPRGVERRNRIMPYLQSPPEADISPFTPTSMNDTPLEQPALSSEVEDAVQEALDRQLELLKHHLDHQVVSTIANCRETVQEWEVDESLVADISMEERIRLLEDYGDEYGLELGDVTLESLSDRIDHLATLIVSFIAEARALEVVQAIEDLLDEHGLDISAVKGSDSYGYFRHYAEREECPWHVYEYRNLEGEGIHVDLYEYIVEGHHLYVEIFLEKGSLSDEEENWDAT